MLCRWSRLVLLAPSSALRIMLYCCEDFAIILLQFVKQSCLPQWFFACCMHMVVTVWINAELFIDNGPCHYPCPNSLWHYRYAYKFYAPLVRFPIMWNMKLELVFSVTLLKQIRHCMMHHKNASTSDRNSDGNHIWKFCISRACVSCIHTAYLLYSVSIIVLLHVDGDTSYDSTWRVL